MNIKIFPATAIGLIGLLSIFSNGFVIAFYLKKRNEVIPLMYIILAACDSVTGTVALFHAYILPTYLFDDQIDSFIDQTWNTCIYQKWIAPEPIHFRT